MQRHDNLLQLLQRNPQAQETLLPPSVESLLPDIEGGAPNLLAFKATFTPLRVDFPMWMNSDPSPEEPEKVQLFWNGQLAQTRYWEKPVQESELFIEAPIEYLTEGTHNLLYTVTLYNGNMTYSKALQITIKKTPPLLPERSEINFPAEIEASRTVTDGYLSRNGDRLEGEVPSYLGAAAGDQISWYWSDSPNGREQVNRRTLRHDDVSGPWVISFPGEFIRQSRNGLRYARYEVQDRAGTPVQRSESKSLNSEATGAPRQLPPPRVKDAEGSSFNSTLLPNNALRGATVIIPESAAIEDGEQITVFWGEPGSVGAYQSSTPTVPGGREFHIPPRFVAMHAFSELFVTYQVKVSETEQPLSQRHHLLVGRIIGLPAPQCADIQSGAIALDSMGEHAVFSIGSWPFHDTDQFVSMWLTGVKQGAVNESITLPIANYKPVPGNAPFEVGRVSKQALTALERGYQFQVTTRVTFEAQGEEPNIYMGRVAAALIDRRS